MKIAKTIGLLAGIALTGITYAAPNLIIKNETHAALDENEYANIQIIVGNWMHQQFQVPQNSTQEVNIDFKDIPVLINADVFFRNKSITKKINCAYALDVNKTTTIIITADENPVTANSTITCQRIES